MIDWNNLLGFHRTVVPLTTAYPFFPSTHRTSAKTEHILDHKQISVMFHKLKSHQNTLSYHHETKLETNISGKISKYLKTSTVLFNPWVWNNYKVFWTECKAKCTYHNPWEGTRAVHAREGMNTAHNQAYSLGYIINHEAYPIEESSAFDEAIGSCRTQLGSQEHPSAPWYQ